MTLIIYFAIMKIKELFGISFMVPRKSLWLLFCTLIRFFMKTNKVHNRMDGNTSVAVSTRWANQGRRVPLLRNKDILLHFDSQYVIFTCICVYKRNQKYFIYIYKGTTPSWILFGRYSLLFAWSIIFLKWLQLSHIPNSKIYA